MRQGNALVTKYRLSWLALVALVISVVLGLVFLFKPPPVAVEEVKFAVQAANPPAQRAEAEAEMLSRLKANMTELQLTVSAGEGQLRLRIWAASARKEGSCYEIEDGLMQFEMKERRTLLLRVEDGRLEYDPRLSQIAATLDSLWWYPAPSTGLLRVDGALTGRIVGTDQYFEATGLVWNQLNGMISTSSVTFRAGDIEVNGQSMTLDLLTGEINFEGAVETALPMQS